MLALSGKLLSKGWQPHDIDIDRLWLTHVVRGELSQDSRYGIVARGLMTLHKSHTPIDGNAMVSYQRLGKRKLMNPCLDVQCVLCYKLSSTGYSGGVGGEGVRVTIVDACNAPHPDHGDLLLAKVICKQCCDTGRHLEGFDP